MTAPREDTATVPADRAEDDAEDLVGDLVDAAALEEAVDLRRHFHRHPEVAFAEHRTREFVARRLAELGVPCTVEGLGTGLIGVLEGTAPTGPRVDVAFRAELDALPVPDETGRPYASTVPGASHACGHDAHLAALLVTCRLLAENRSRWAGRVVLLFQPAEELPPGGALGLLAARVLRPGTAVYGAHLASDLPTGRVEVTTGPVQSANDRFDVVVHGVGGHGAVPELSQDALLAASAVVVALQSVVSRTVSPFEPAVVSVGAFRAGDAFNAIADHAELRGTVRTHSPATRTTVHRMLERVVDGAARAHGCTADVEWTAGYPAVVNDAGTARHTLAVLQRALGADVVPAARPRMESDDFAYYLQQHPGNFFFVGSGGPDPATRNPHHHPAFDLDERSLGTVVRAYLALALADGERLRP